MAIITPAYITQTYLTQLGAEHDAALATLIANVESMIGNLIAPVAFGDWANASAKVVSWYGGEYFYLPAHKTGTLGAIVRQQDSATVDAGSYTAETGDIYGTVEVNKPLYRRAGWAPGRYSITAQWGYGPVPAALQEVCAELVVNIWRSKDSGTFSDVVAAPGGNAVGYNKALTGMQREALSALRRRYLGGILV